MIGEKFERNVYMENVKLVRAKESDLELILSWRSHPDIYKYFRMQKAPFSWKEHVTFWKNRKHRVDFIILLSEEKKWRKVGTLNLSELDTDSPAIGILIGELTLQHKGVGSKALQLALQWLKTKKYAKACAEIHSSNTASQKLFLKNGFKKVNQATGKDWQAYQCNLR